MSRLRVWFTQAAPAVRGCFATMEVRPGTGTPPWGALALLLALLAAAGGCGPSGPATYPVSGTVTFNGEPLPDGYITFFPDDPSVGPEGSEIKNGEFSFRAREGAKTVKIEASRFVGPLNPVMGLTPKEQYIPEKYNTSSTLTVEVTPDGDNTFNYELTDQVDQE